MKTLKGPGYFGGEFFIVLKRRNGLVAKDIVGWYFVSTDELAHMFIYLLFTSLPI